MFNKPYFSELRLGFEMVPWLWHFSKELIVSILVYFCHQCVDKQFLHMVWDNLDHGVEKSAVFLATIYEALSRLSRLSFINWLCGQVKWLLIGSSWLSMIVLNDLPVTNIISSVVRGSPIICRNFVTLIFCNFYVIEWRLFSTKKKLNAYSVELKFRV